jgi:hypothetical protein
LRAYIFAQRLLRVPFWHSRESRFLVPLNHRRPVFDIVLQLSNVILIHVSEFKKSKDNYFF